MIRRYDPATRRYDVDRRRPPPPEPAQLIDAVPLSAAALTSEGASFATLLSALWRHRAVIAAVMILFMAVAAVIASQQIPRFAADGAIVIASRKLMVPGLEALSTPTGDVAIIRSEMAVLRSRTLLREVADALRLDTKPEFNPYLRAADNTLLAWVDPRPLIRRLLHPDGETKADKHDIIAAEVEWTLRKNLDLVNDERDYVITVRYRSEDPVLSAAIVNTLIGKYVSQYVEMKVAAAQEANESLNARAEELHQELVKADARVEEFNRRNQVLETRFGTNNTQQLEDLSTQLSLAHADRAATEARYRQALVVGHGGDSIAANTEVLASPLIQKLREQEAEVSRNRSDLAMRVGPNHPDRKAVENQLSGLRGMIHAEVGKVMASLKGQAETARTREATLQAKVAQLQDAARGAAELRDQAERLKADATAKRKTYDELRTKIAETAKPSDRQPVDARIISNAVAPIAPADSRGVFFILLAGIIGGLTATAGVLGYDRLDHGFHSLDEVRNATGLPAYAALPAVRHRGRATIPPRYVIDHPHSAFAETLRGFRARLRWTAADPKVILVTSAVPGEGKTTVALAFARITAQDGWRVLLIECDLRRPALKRTLSPSPGTEITKLVDGKLRWQDCIRTDTVSGLHYLVPAEHEPSFPAALETAGLDRLIGELRSTYDYIVIDTPPVMRVPDATVLARSVDTVVLIVSWRRTRQRLVAEALRRLSLHRDKPIGIVLTKVTGRDAVQDIYTGYRFAG
jgi:capsular exopolysaccharide synthesis family protein